MCFTSLPCTGSGKDYSFRIKRGMDIEGLGEKNVELLYSRGS